MAMPSSEFDRSGPTRPVPNEATSGPTLDSPADASESLATPGDRQQGSPLDHNTGIETSSNLDPPTFDSRSPNESPATQDEFDAEIERHETRNFVLLAIQQVVLRTGWIFKTETVIMPAFLDTIAGAGWLRGCLPMLNRFGQSVPPLLFSRRLKIMRHKKWALVTMSVLMAVPFATLSAVWWAVGGQTSTWLPGLFLVLYALFFIINGLSQLSYGTLQGKLIRATRRGRLIATTAVFSSVTSILCAFTFLGGWLENPGIGFVYIFGTSATLFALAAVSLLAIKEPADDMAEPRVSVGQTFYSAWRILRDDRNFRRLAAVVMLFATIQILFPHFQALGRERLNLTGKHLMLWVIVQNAGLGVFSLLAGLLADRRGNRLTLRLLILASAAAPLAAIGVSRLGPEVGQNWYWTVFVMLGLVPITMRTLINYTLEIADPAQHPRYLSTLGLCLAAPFFAAPAVGLLIDKTSFEVVFLTGAALLALGGSLTYRLAEPRHKDRGRVEVASSVDDA